MRWLDSIINSMNMNLNNIQELVEDRGAWNTVVYKVTKSQTQLGNRPTMGNKTTECSLFPS